MQEAAEGDERHGISVGQLQEIRRPLGPLRSMTDPEPFPPDAVRGPLVAEEEAGEEAIVGKV